MKRHDLLETMGHIDPAYVMEAERATLPARRWKPLVAVAAGVCVSVAAVVNIKYPHTVDS